MRYLWLAVIVFALFGVSSCGLVEVRDPNVLSYNEHRKLGAIYESKGEYELALREYEGALALDKKEPGARFAMGNVRLKMKDYAKAEEEFNASIEANPSADAYNNLSWVYIEQGRIEDGRAMAGKAIGYAAPGKGYIYLDTLGDALTRRS